MNPIERRDSLTPLDVPDIVEQAQCLSPVDVTKLNPIWLQSNMAKMRKILVLDSYEYPSYTQCETIRISKSKTIWGRNPLCCDTVVQHSQVSRRHGCIMVHGASQAVYVVDLNSCHGTYIAHRRMKGQKSPKSTKSSQSRDSQIKWKLVNKRKPTMLEQGTRIFFGNPDKVVMEDKARIFVFRYYYNIEMADRLYKLENLEILTSPKANALRKHTFINTKLNIGNAYRQDNDKIVEQEQERPKRVRKNKVTFCTKPAKTIIDEYS